MNQAGRNFLKGMFRTLEVGLLIVMLLAIIELTLIYKDAHDNPDRYVASRSQPSGSYTNVSAPSPMSEVPGRRAEAERVRRDDDQRRRRQGGLRPPAPPTRVGRPATPAPSSGNVPRAPQIMEFTRIRNHVVNYFFDRSSIRLEESETNGAPAEMWATNSPTSALARAAEGSSPAEDGRIGTVVERIGRPPHGFRFAIP